MSKSEQTSGQAGAGEPGQAVGGRAAGGGLGLDLSLGHIGTDHSRRAWIAVCDACQASMLDADYEAAEVRDGLGYLLAEPRCTSCGRQAWSFHDDLV